MRHGEQGIGVSREDKHIGHI
jgi:hypothetical protein